MWLPPKLRFTVARSVNETVTVVRGFQLYTAPRVRMFLPARSSGFTPLRRRDKPAATPAERNSMRGNGQLFRA